MIIGQFIGKYNWYPASFADNHSSARFSLPEGSLTTYDTYPDKMLPDGRVRVLLFFPSLSSLPSISPWVGGSGYASPGQMPFILCLLR
jgi:hypothetical protein